MEKNKKITILWHSCTCHTQTRDREVLVNRVHDLRTKLEMWFWSEQQINVLSKNQLINRVGLGWAILPMRKYYIPNSKKVLFVKLIYKN